MFTDAICKRYGLCAFKSWTLTGKYQQRFEAMARGLAIQEILDYQTMW
jgi:hypothetical protein